MSCLKIFCLCTLVLALSMLGGMRTGHAADKLPLEITADQQLEWNQQDQTYVARGNAKAVQGEFSVTADTLTAHYAEDGQSAQNADNQAAQKNSGGAGNITKLTAAGNVVLRSSHDHATAANAQYDLITEVIELNGARPKLYRDNDVLEADQVIITLKNHNFDHADAMGNVIITKGAAQDDETQTQPKQDKSGQAQLQRAVADHAHYDGVTEIVTLKGHVKLWQEESWVEGSEAVLNLKNKTNILKADTGDKNASGRVKGIFYSAQSKSEQLKLDSQSGSKSSGAKSNAQKSQDSPPNIPQDKH